MHSKICLILYDGAERMLRQMGLDPKSVNPAEIRADYEAMQSRKSILEKTYKKHEKEAITLQQKCSNVEQFVGLENPLSNEHTMEKIRITIIIAGSYHFFVLLRFFTSFSTPLMLFKYSSSTGDNVIS